MHRSHSATYVHHPSKGYTPMNIIQSAGINCIHCGVMIPPHQFSNHSQMHMPSNRPLRSNKIKIPKKISLDFMLDDKQNAQDLGVKSLLPNEVPQKEPIRKQAKLNKWSSCQKLTDLRIQQFNKVLFDQIKHYNKDVIGDQYVSKEDESNMKLIKRIKMKKQIVKMTKKRVNYYQSQKKQVPFIDQYRSPPKVFRKPQNMEKSGYKIEKIKEKVQQQPIKIEILSVKKTKLKEKVGTISTKGSFFGNRLSHGSETQSGNPFNKLQCRGCKGFYCYECGSDIPPQYRPVDPNLSPINSVTIQQFYRDHIYKHNSSRDHTSCPTCSD